MRRIFPILLLAYVAYLVFTTSCANPGMPTGGPKDSIPPDVVKTVPEFNATNFDKNEISLTFNEFVDVSKLREVLVVSPPLKQRPAIRTKAKTLIIDLGDSLKQNTTYSLDFKSAIVDNNEQNPLEDFRFAFSTGSDFDSLMIGGYVKNAKDLEPVEGAVVMLHSVADIEAFKDTFPDYIATTDEDGFYVISNIAAGTYRLYALEDADNSLTYNQLVERIAFIDTLISPLDLSLPTYQTDTVAGDTLSIKTKRRNALETPFFLMLFEEDFFDQYIDSYGRDQANMISLYFTESLSDSFNIELLKPEPMTDDWSFLEFNPTKDSLQIWLTDTVLSHSDSLLMNVSYLIADSLSNLVLKHDTLEFNYSKPEEPEKRRRKKKEDDEPDPIPHISFRQKIKSSGFDVYRNIKFEAPEPLKSFDWSAVHLYQKADTLEKELEFEMWQDSSSIRKFYISYPWGFMERYRLEIDSSAAYNYEGYPSNELSSKFTTQEESYYAKIILQLNGLVDWGIVQLLDNSDKEKVLQQIVVNNDGEIEFPFLNPEKYKIRLIIDHNHNGRWDTGDLDEGVQPEQVMYYNKVLKLRSNFEIKETWNLPLIQYDKELIDEDKQKEDAKKDKKKKPQRSSGGNF